MTPLVTDFTPPDSGSASLHILHTFIFALFFPGLPASTVCCLLIYTSKGCKIWVVWAGIPRSSILFVLASCMTSILMWDSWLWRTSSTGWAEPQWGMKVSLNHLKNKSLFIYNVVRHRESIQPLTKNTIPICCMRKRFSKIIMEERIVPLTQMHRCPVICPDAKRLCWYACSHLKPNTFCLPFSLIDQPVSSQLKILPGLFSISSPVTLSEQKVAQNTV